MKIAVIGAGNVGSALAKGWIGKGHEVFFGVLNPRDEKTVQLVQSLGNKAQAGTDGEAAAFGQVVVVATPWDATEAAIKACGDLRGKIVIDCINPLTPDLSGVTLGFNTSAAERIAGWARGAKVVKAFNTAGANIMADPVINGTRTVMFVCGDDDPAKATVLQLAADIGFEAVDAGKLMQARLLEPLAVLWIALAIKNAGRDFAFALLKRDAPA